jgi:hypothetical protein
MKKGANGTLHNGHPFLCFEYLFESIQSVQRNLKTKYILFSDEAALKQEYFKKKEKPGLTAARPATLESKQVFSIKRICFMFLCAFSK